MPSRNLTTRKGKAALSETADAESAVVVRRACTPAEIATARRLRYEVFFSELGDARYANHATEQWGDEADGTAIVLNAYDCHDAVVGTVRVELSCLGPVRVAHVDQPEHIAAQLGLSVEEFSASFAKLTRMAVAAAVRGGGIGDALMDRAEALARLHLAKCVYVAVSKSNRRTIQFLRRRRYQAGPTTTDAFAGQVLFRRP